MIEQISVKGFDDNFSYIIHDDTHAVVVDPSGDIEKVFSVLSQKNLEPVAVFLTHSHFDHYDKLDVFLAHYKVPIHMPVHAHTKAKGNIDVDIEITGVEEGDVIPVGTVLAKVLYTPGHSDDSVCYFIEKEKSIITGDTLFVEGAGRVSGERDAEALYKTLQRLKALPDDTQIFPGHDYGSRASSTILWEKEHNRFFLAKNLDEFKTERL